MLTFDLIAFFTRIFCYFAVRMTKFRVEITEILSRIVELDADNEEDALELARRMYRNCDIILDSSDYVETEISVKK